MRDSNSVSGKWSYYLSGLFIVLLLTIFHETVESMVEIWLRSKTFAHCFLIIPISAWLIWQRREQLAALDTRKDFRALIFLLFSGFVWLVSSLANVLVFQQLSLIAMLISGVWAIIGNEAYRIIRFPLLFLFFVVPMGEWLVPWLMENTAWFVVAMIRLTGIPVYQEGLTIYLPSGSWQVIEACSGIRYLIASLTLGCLFAYINYSGWVKKLIFVGFSIVVPILANGVRAFIIVMLGHLTSQKLVAGDHHIVIGWIFYGLVIFILFAIGSFWRDPQPYNIPVNTTQNTKDYLKISNWAGAFLITILVTGLSGFWPVLFHVAYKQALTAASSEFEPDILIPDIPLISHKNLSWIPPEGSASVVYDGLYFFRNKQVGLHLRTYLAQQQNNELVSSQNTLLSRKIRSQQKIVSRKKISIQLQDKQFEIMQLVIREREQKGLLIWSWYSIGGIYTSNDYVAKVLEAYRRLTFDRRGSTRVILVTPIDDISNELQPSKALLEEFTNVAISQLDNALVRIESPES